MTHKPTLIVIQSTHASLSGFKSTGLFDRHKRLLKEYSKTFRVVLYSSDTIDYSKELGVEHRHVPWLPKAFGWRHAVFYVWLVLQAPRMKGVIKVFGSNIPTLPSVRFFSRQRMLVTYQWNYVEQTRRNEPRGLRHWLAGLLERLALKCADIVLVTTPRLQEKVRKVYNKPTVLVPNWVDLTQINISANSVRNNYQILYAGRLHKSKGVDYLIKAFAQVKQKHALASLIICGAGEEEMKLQAIVQQLGVRDVVFKGSVLNEQVLKLMQSAAIFVLPTLTMEGHPKALIEAMACGAACVASDIPGNRDVITSGQSGILVPASDVDALADALERLLGDKSLRDHLGQAAQAKASQYSFSKIVSREIQMLAALAGISLRQNYG